MSTTGDVQVLFASCTSDLIPRVIAEMKAMRPSVPLLVVSEFQPPEGEWIQFHILRSVRENVELCRARVDGRRVVLSAFVLDPDRPYKNLRRTALRAWPRRVLVFDERLHRFMLSPPGAFGIARHFLRRARDLARRQIRPRGFVYRWLWRFGHPQALRRPFFYRTALAAGALTRLLKRTSPKAPPPELEKPLARGVSVVIPSRNGRELLAHCLPRVLEQMEPGAGEVIIVDNGSDDGTVEYLKSAYPCVLVEHSEAALSFASAVNLGIRRAAFAHVCLLNNDMLVERGFVSALLDAFDHVTDLFCATAQIFLPEGQRREETGKAVMPLHRPHDAFPVTCDLPLEGEGHSYVLYGSGGASLYDTRKLRALGGVAEVYQPAYVEDLDLGFNGWRLGWPTVFVRRARVLHRHRATTSRYYTQAQLDLVLERNYLRFLARSISDRALFRSLWTEAVDRVNIACLGRPEYVQVLQEASRAPAWMEPLAPAVLPDREILATGSGAIAVFAGRPPRSLSRVMVASPYVPFPLAHGGAVRMYNLMRRAAQSFDQVLICFTDELAPPPPELLAITIEVVYVKRYPTHAIPGTHRPDVVEEYDSPAFRAALHRTIHKWKPAIAQLEFTQMAQYAADCAPARTILVEHDITLDLYAQLLASREDWETRRQYERWVEFEQRAWESVRCIVTMSAKDREVVAKPTAVALRNGVDIVRFEPSPVPPDPCRILFIGSFAHLPNLLAIDFFLRETWPLLMPFEPTLHIIAGSSPEYFLDLYKQRVQPPLQQPGIHVDGFVADVRPAYRRAAVVIAPLVASAGTNIKIMEAMAMGKAVVSTPAGVNGLDDLNNGHDVVIVNTGEEMAAAIAALLDDPVRRREIEQHARRTAVSSYDWDVIGREQARLYRSLL